jgi:endonuclease YncB( thermonuclease family)
MPILRLFALLAILPTLLACTATARGATRPCVPGDPASPVCQWWTGKVKLVADGDTIDVKIGRKVQSIRFTGINAMELSKYSHTASKRRGACHGLEAAAFVDRAVRASHGRVRLAAQHASSRSGRRLRRSVWVKSGGQWRDLARMELAAGHALWMPNTVEWQHNTDYAQVAADAVAAGRNLYDPDGCGAGPDADLPIDVLVNWDADGADEQNLNGEFVDIRNNGDRVLDLGGWWLRDSALRYSAGKVPGFRFPAGTVVPADDAIRLHVGCGTNTATDLFWCLQETVFENVDSSKGAGDGGYLFDPRGNLRSLSIYPCLTSCKDILAGNARMTVHASEPEYITIRNLGTLSLDLVGHSLKLRNHGQPDQYVFSWLFGLGSTILPGGTYTYHPPEPNMLSNNGGVVELRSLTNVLSDCVAWGFGRC